MFKDFRQSIDRNLNRFRSKEEVRRRVARSMDNVARDTIVPRARENAPSETGDLKRSIEFFGGEWHDDTYVIEVGSDLEYARYVELDTKPHPITADKAPFLHFYWDKKGTWMKTYAVQHPGTRGQHFLEDAFESSEVRNELERVATDEFEGYIRAGI